MKVIFRPLDKAIEIAESTGLEVTYAYEDLVFSEHSVFILQFDDLNKSQLMLYFNKDCTAPTASDLTATMSEKAKEIGFQLVRKGSFSLLETEGNEEIQINFF